MAEVDQTIAAQVKVPQPADVIGPISSLAQLQYMQANAQRAAAETQQIGLNTQLTQNKLQSLQAYNDAVAGGATPEDALTKSGLGGYDPTGANAIMSNAQTGMTLKGNRAYAANPTNPLSAAPGGPGLVSTAATAANTQATTQETALKNAAANAQLHGQLGNIMASDPSPQGRAQAAAFARQAFPGPQTEALIAQAAQLPDAQYVLAGQHFQQASMTPEVYARVSGQEEQNKGVAEAQTFNKPLGAGETLAQGPLAHAAYAGQPLPSGNPALGNFGPPQQAAPSLASLSGAPAAPTAGPVQTNAQGVAIDPATGKPTQAGPIYQAGFEPSAPSLPARATAFGPSNLPAPGAVPAGPALGAPSSASTAGGGSPGLSNNKNNNPGNVRDGAFAQSQPGYIGSNNGFAVFSSPLMGQAAMEKNLISYGKQGIDTPAAIAAKWAPAGDGANDPTAYANFIAGRLGIGPNDKINVNDPAQRSALAVAMSQQENGGKGYLGPNVSGSLIGARAVSGSLSPSPVLAGAPPLANLPLTSGAAPILSPNLQRSQPGQPPLLPTPPVQTAAPAPTPQITPVAANAPPTAVAPPPALAPQATAVRPAPVAAANSPAAAPNAAAANPLTYTPVTQGMSIQQKAEQEALGKANVEVATAGPIEMAKGVAEAQVKQFADAKEAYNAANTAQLKVTELQHSLGDLPSSGFLAPGSDAEGRIKIAKYANTLLSGIGAAPLFDPKAVGSAESAQKITGGLGFDMSRSLGAREAAQIVKQAISLNPGIENTPQGAKVIAGAINAGLQRTKDFYQFLRQDGNKTDSDIAFNGAHPISQYAQEAQTLATIPQAYVERLQKHADNPIAAQQFDQRFGPGMARYFTGQ